MNDFDKILLNKFQISDHINLNNNQNIMQFQYIEIIDY